ncbi:MAG: alginate export family protein [Phycisphaerae bacterium]|nr:alginate export family protein [Phycisphaerae bacterium]
MWGESEQLQDNANLNIHEAWAKIYLSEKVGIKLGRQELVYDDQRLLGSVNWTQQARSHDALLLRYNDAESDFQLDLGGAYNQESENLFGNTYALNNYKALGYIWMNKQLAELEASVLLLTDGFEAQSGQANFRYTYGTNLNYSKQNWQLNGSAYLQSGDDATRRDISAYMMAINGTYRLGSVKFKAGYDYLSGGSADDANPSRKTFHTLYATNHKFYGHMDYFLNIPANTNGGGLQDLYLGASYNLSQKTNLALTYHYLALANSITNPSNTTETLDTPLGSEFDFSLSYNVSEDVIFKMGYSALVAGSSLDQLQIRNGKQSQHWGWAMFVISPEIIQ